MTKWPWLFCIYRIKWTLHTDGRLWVTLHAWVCFVQHESQGWLVFHVFRVPCSVGQGRGPGVQPLASWDDQQVRLFQCVITTLAWEKNGLISSLGSSIGTITPLYNFIIFIFELLSFIVTHVLKGHNRPLYIQLNGISFDFGENLKRVTSLYCNNHTSLLQCMSKWQATQPQS